MAEITIKDLTEGTLNGHGVFDELMRASKAHLDAEWGKGTIRGPEYSQVYLGQLQAAMSQALAFLAQRQRIGLEAQLLEKQILLADKQLEQATAQIALTTQETINAGVQKEVLEAQICLLKAQYENTMAQVIKGQAEIDLLKQKVVTEKAQTIELGVDDNSVIGRQKNLYLAQTKGFDRDAEQKAVKLWVDSWNARRMTDEGTSANTTNMLDDSVGGRLMTKMLNGINA